MMKTVYLIRHAQSHIASGVEEADWPLSPRGRSQADHLARLLGPLGIDRLYSSPYERCLHTLRPFAEGTGVDVVVHSHLRERKITEGLRRDFYEIWQRSWEDFSFALPGCENSGEAQNRFVTAVEEIIASEGASTIGIGTHGNVIALLLNRLDSTFGINEANALGNPDVVRLAANLDGLTWDRSFRLPGIEAILTPHGETPIDW